MMGVSADANNGGVLRIALESVGAFNRWSLRAIKNDQTKAKLCLDVS